MNWMDMSLSTYQDALASTEPTPGGGTASAIALGQAVGLTRMVSSLTLGNEKWESGWSAARLAEEVCAGMYERCGELAQMDSEAFDRVMKSFRLPKSNDDEIQSRRLEIRQSTLNAAEVPSWQWKCCIGCWSGIALGERCCERRIVQCRNKFTVTTVGNGRKYAFEYQSNSYGLQ